MVTIYIAQIGLPWSLVTVASADLPASLTGHLGIAESLVSTDPASPTIPLGTHIGVLDRFDTTNNFHGADLGLTGEFRRGPWVLEWTTKVALGGNGGSVDIGGVTNVTVPGFAPTITPAAFSRCRATAAISIGIASRSCRRWE